MRAHMGASVGAEFAGNLYKIRERELDDVCPACTMDLFLSHPFD